MGQLMIDDSDRTVRLDVSSLLNRQEYQTQEPAGGEFTFNRDASKCCFYDVPMLLKFLINMIPTGVNCVM